MRSVIRPIRVLLISCFALLLPNARALADGCFVWKNRGIDVLAPEQKAFIFHDQGREDLVLSVRYDGAPEDFGWIVPLPSVPEMFPEDTLLFSVLSRETQRRRYDRSERCSRFHLTAGTEVLSTQRVGIYDTQIVEATAGEELQSWLLAHGYQLPSGAGGVLDRYIQDGWVFATLKIVPSAIDSTTTARLQAGTIPPIRFRFACPEPIFPLEISSVMSGGTEILLYVLSRNITVPMTPKPESWENQINSRPGEHHWIYQFEQEARTAKFLPQYQEPYYLTKHRVRLEPEEMKDVRFGPYDPSRSLRSSLEAERLEAIAYLGRIKPAGALGLLLGRLRAQPTRSERFSLLWALGELGGPEAEQVLLVHAEGPDPEVRIEAVDALGRMRSHAALPCLIRGLEYGLDASGFEQVFMRRSFRMACFEWLVTHGDSTCLGELRRMAEEHRGAERWREPSQPWNANDVQWQGMNSSDLDSGLLAVAALAACGDKAARREMLRAVVVGGQETTAPQAIASTADRGGSINSFPSGFWTGRAVLMKSSGFQDWRALTRVYLLFQSAPSLRTSLLEEAAADPSLPHSGAIVLLGNVDSLSTAAAERLMRLWRESIREPRRYLEVLVGDSRQSPTRSVRYNYDGCAIAYALSRHKRIDELKQLWSTRPKDDQVLEGDLVFAMAQTLDPRFRKIVLDYVRRVWGEAARSEEFEYYLAGSILDKRTSRLSFFQLETAPFDLGYRTRVIWQYLLGYPTDADFERALLTDRNLPPYLRLAALSQVNYFAESQWKLLPVARTELDTLRMSWGGRGGLAAQIADSLHRRFERTARRIAELREKSDPAR